MLTNLMNESIQDYNTLMKNSLLNLEMKDAYNDRKSMKKKMRGRELISEIWLRCFRQTSNQPESKKYSGF